MPDIERLVGELREATIIVEGKKDASALKGLGLVDIVPINGKPLIDLVEGLQISKKIVILTDFDKEGKRLNSRLMALLQRYKIPTNVRLRKMMQNLGRTRIEDFANLQMGITVKASKRKEGDSHGETCANFNKVHNQGKNKSKRGNRKA